MSMKMVVLGILMEGNRHPYDMQQLIKTRYLDQYIKMQKGSLYYTVEQLEKSGLIEVDSIVRDTNHPDKTIYAITESGKKEFHDLLFKELREPQHVFFPLFEAIAFMKHLDKKELIPAIEERIANAEKHLNEFEKTYEIHQNRIPKYGLRIMTAGIEYCQLELTLLRNLVSDLENDSFNKPQRT